MARILWLVVLVGCTSSELPSGEAVFRAPVTGGNTFACATCHAIDEGEDGLRRPGHALGDAFRRPSYKNGHEPTLLGAVNTCLTEWMAAPAWGEGDAQWIALRDWLASLAPAAPAPALAFEIVPPPAALAGGDATRGRALFNETCIVCHGRDAAGTERGPGLAGFGHEPAFVARRVRTSGRTNSDAYDGLTGGRMPFWSADRLSDAELIDLVAYVESSEGSGPTNPGGGGGEPLRTCASTHAKVGATATLNRHAHNVGGTARIVDDCTIAIDGFTYDGGGIDVRVYAGKAGNYGGGYAISENFVGKASTGGTKIVQLPVGKTLDDLDGISIWCVAAKFSFGDGLFP